MAKMTDYNPEHYAELLGARAESIGVETYPMTVNKKARTVFIGLGGSGIQTLEYIKETLSRNMEPGWEYYTGFLSIDSDPYEMKKVKVLKPDTDRLVYTTCADVGNRQRDARLFPRGWNYIADGETIGSAFDLSSEGAGGHRLIGKLKTYDKSPLEPMAVEEKIVAELIRLRANLMPTSLEPWNVYVLGSACGGTGGGMFTQMPALIRKAYSSVQDLKIYGFLYLPDVFAGQFPTSVDKMAATGYATLKELDYYQGISMRAGYWDRMMCNDPNFPEIICREENGYYTVPYLIGEPGDSTLESKNNAVETVGRYLTNLLGAEIHPNCTAFAPNTVIEDAMTMGREREFHPNDDGREAPGAHHEFPKTYGTIGFATASLPTETARAYAISKLCKSAGIRPVSFEERVNYNGPEELKPFREENDMLYAAEGTAIARKILEPLGAVMDEIYKKEPMLDYTEFYPDISWRNFCHDEVYCFRLGERERSLIRKHTNEDSMKAIETIMEQAFAQVKKNIQAYVEKEGPLAYANLFDGRFIPGSTDPGIGICQMLTDLLKGCRLGTQEEMQVISPEEAERSLNEMRNMIADMSGGLIGAITQRIDRLSAASQWVFMRDNFFSSIIIRERKERFLGENGLLRQKIVDAMISMAKKIRAFGHILSTLSNLYTAKAGAMTCYDSFCYSKDSFGDVNIAATTAQTYTWLKTTVDQAVNMIDPAKLRKSMVESFFLSEGSYVNEDWMKVPEGVTDFGGTPRLRNPGSPACARKLFDELFDSNLSLVLDLSVESFFRDRVARTGDMEGATSGILQILWHESRLRIRGHIPENRVERLIMYPVTLDGIAQEYGRDSFGEVANRIFPNARCYPTSNTNKILMYQIGGPFEIYRLDNLKEWECRYESKLEDNYIGKYLHGYSPLVEAVGGNVVPEMRDPMPWKNFPNITAYDDATGNLNPITGEISREGKLRRELRSLMEKARELGVLYTGNNNGYCVNRVYCDPAMGQWKVNPSAMSLDEKGRLPKGVMLMEEIALQNGTSLRDISKRVLFANGGVLSCPAPTEELAWANAEKVLRKHPAMYMEVKNTVDLVTAGLKKFEDEN